MAVTPDLVAEIKHLVAAALISMEPAFDERIKQLTNIKKEVEDRLGLIKSIDQAEARAKSIVADAERTATARLKVVEGRISDLEHNENMLRTQTKELQQEQDSFEKTKTEHQSKMEEESRRMAASLSSLASREARIDTKEKDLAAAEESLHKREEELVQHTRRIREAVHPIGR